MTDPIKKHRNELAENGVEQTPAEVEEWFGDVAEFFDVAQLEVPKDELVDRVKQLKEKLFPGR